MMPSNFTGNFSKLLKSWQGDLTQVYQGPPDGTCYDKNDTTCYPDFDWLLNPDPVQGYRARLYQHLPSSTGYPWAQVEAWPDEVSNDMDEFWACSPGEEYTLLVISPQSAVASKLLDPTTGAAARACITEIVFMGGLFGNVQLSQSDPETALSMVGPRGHVGDYDNPARLTEVNIISDVPAANALWVKNLAELEVPMRILSLETASCARVGVQKILFRGQTGNYTADEQTAAEEKAVDEIRANLDCQQPPNMLTKMFCIHKGCDIATLDFDIVAASYAWLGDADKTVQFHFQQIRPKVNLTTGVTAEELANGTDVWRATTFDAPAWIGLLAGKLHGH